MPNTFFAVGLGIIGLVALVAAVRSAGQARVGWAVIAVAAAIQVWNLLTDYSFILAIVTTVGIIAGYVVTRRGAEAPREA